MKKYFKQFKYLIMHKLRVFKECAIDRLDCAMNRKKIVQFARCVSKKLKPKIDKLNNYLKEKQLSYNLNEN